MNNINYTNGILLPIFNSLTLKLLVCFLLFFSFQSGKAQSVLPPKDSYISIENNEGIVGVIVNDSTTVSEIEVSLGSKGSYNDLFSNSYIFDQTTGLPSGLTYSREGFNIALGVGTLAFPPAFNVRVRIKDTNGNWSSYLEYISN